MRTLSGSLFDLSIYFTFLLFIIFSFQHFLLPFTFLEASRLKPCALPPRSWGPTTTSTPPQVIRTLPAQMCHSPREHAWLKCQHGSGSRTVVSPKRSRHPSVMSHMLSHSPQNTSTRSLLLTSLIFRPSSPSLSCSLELDRETLRDSRPEWRI